MVACGAFTTCSQIINNWWTYRIKVKQLSNELAIANLHDCIDAHARIMDARDLRNEGRLPDPQPILTDETRAP